MLRGTTVHAVGGTYNALVYLPGILVLQGPLIQDLAQGPGAELHLYVQHLHPRGPLSTPFFVTITVALDVVFPCNFTPAGVDIFPTQQYAVYHASNMLANAKC